MNEATTIKKYEYIKAIIFNLLSIVCIYLIPAFSHNFGIPLYLFEPMRIMIILALAHTSKENTFLLAATLPIISFFLSGHPIFPKMLVISAELIVNVWLFLFFSKFLKIKFLNMFLAIALSKAFYYLIIFILIQLSLYDKPLHSTPFANQLIVTILLSAYTAIFLRPKNDDKFTS